MAKSKCIFGAALVCICLTFQGVSSFSLDKLRATRTQQPIIAQNILLQPTVNNEVLSSITMDQRGTNAGCLKVDNNLKQSLLAGCITFLTTTPLSAFAETVDDLEIVELPPVYVPILFAIGVLGGVGVLTASLGNVMDEGEYVLSIYLCRMTIVPDVSIFCCTLISRMVQSSMSFTSTEASLGLQSGARAKKERDRSRSSYFKK
jgi:hypothetical protein